MWACVFSVGRPKTLLVLLPHCCSFSPHCRPWMLSLWILSLSCHHLREPPLCWLWWICSLNNPFYPEFRSTHGSVYGPVIHSPCVPAARCARPGHVRLRSTIHSTVLAGSAERILDPSVSLLGPSSRDLKQYLRCFANQEQDNWADVLVVTEFAYNNSQHISIQVISFFTSYVFCLCLFPLAPSDSPMYAFLQELQAQ